MSLFAGTTNEKSFRRVRKWQFSGGHFSPARDNPRKWKWPLSVAPGQLLQEGKLRVSGKLFFSSDAKAVHGQLVRALPSAGRHFTTPPDG